MNDEIRMTNDETNPNDRNDKCPNAMFNGPFSVIPSEVEESREGSLITLRGLGDP